LESYSHIHLAQERTDIRRARAEGDSHAGRAGRPSFSQSRRSADLPTSETALARNRSFASRTLSLIPSPRSGSPVGRAKSVVSGFGVGAGAVGSVVASTLKRAVALPRKAPGQETETKLEEQDGVDEEEGSGEAAETVKSG